MQKNNKTYQSLVEGAQQQKLQVVKQQQKEIRTIYQNIADNYVKSLNRLNPKSLTYRRMEDYSRALLKEYKNAGKEMNRTIKQNMEECAKIAVNPQLSFFNSVCEGANINFSFSSMFSRVPKEAVAEIYSGNIYADNKSLSKRIWGSLNKNCNDIQRVIAEGIAAKKSLYDLAKDLEAYVNPNAEKPRTRY